MTFRPSLIAPDCVCFDFLQAHAMEGQQLSSMLWAVARMQQSLVNGSYPSAGLHVSIGACVLTRVCACVCVSLCANRLIRCAVNTECKRLGCVSSGW